jgi:two-component system sensor histidine kinase CiaH
VFRRARIRLTAWYVGVLAVFLAALCTGVYLVQRSQLQRNVDQGLHSIASRAEHDYFTRHFSDLTTINDGLRYQVVFSTGGQVVRSSRRAAAVGLPIQSQIRDALTYGSDLKTIAGSSGKMRVYSMRVTPTLAVQVARSVDPEDQALENLLAVMLIGGAISLAVAAVGGWFLAGRSLAPVRDAFERQRAFVGDASHELRTPLAVIRANAEFLQTDNAESVELADILSETDRLSALVDALLALARGESADRPPADLFDLGREVESAVDALMPLAQDHQVVLAVDAAAGLHVQGDREQLRQLVVILVDNALRYTHAGGAVDVDVDRSGDHASIVVHDNGIGINTAEQAKVFDRFYRADEARNRDGGGVGLGLAIAKQLVEEHGGRIAVESAPGKGSTFTVRLPLASKGAPESLTV